MVVSVALTGNLERWQRAGEMYGAQLAGDRVQEQIKKIARGEISPFDIEGPERISKRLTRIGFGTIAKEVQRTGTVDADELYSQINLHDELEQLALERIIGKSDFLSVAFLEKAWRLAASVARIRVQASPNSVLAYGTGFLVSPRLLLTNHHVFNIDDKNFAATSFAEFNYQQGVDGRMLHSQVFQLSPHEFYLEDRELDLALVAVSQYGLNKELLSDYGWNPLIEEQGKILVGEYVNVIQHPRGEPKQIAIRENRLVGLEDIHLHYETDTDAGGSGAPVFNDQWEVIGLHHSAVPRMKDGNILTKDGRRFKRGMSTSLIDWLANEGIRISRVVAFIKAAALQDSLASKLRSDMFMQELPKMFESPFVKPVSKYANESSEFTNGATQIVNKDGSIRLSVPLNITVSLGDLCSTTAEPPKVSQLKQKSGQVSEDPEVRSLLSELEAARQQKYYDPGADGRSRDAYYGQVVELKAQALWHGLNSLLKTSHKKELRYAPAKHLYPWVDLQPDMLLRSIYTGDTYEPEQLILETMEIQRAYERQLATLETKLSISGKPELLAEIAALEAMVVYNCEHTVPQSWFQKREPMRGDLHHLFTCESTCNSFRGNTPYYDFEDYEEAFRESCGKLEGNKFEPYTGKGPAARATMYFLLRYPGEIDDQEKEFERERLPILLEWHKAFPVDEYELHRNWAIHQKQGNRNPFIDFPELAERVDFMLGLG